MLISLVLIIVFIASFYFTQTAYMCSGIELIVLVMGLVSGLLLFIAIIAIPISRLDCGAKLAEMDAVRYTQMAGQKLANPYEAATFQNKVSELNQWLASAQFYNKTIFDIWYIDEIENAKFIN